MWRVCGAVNKTLGDDGAVAVGDAVAAGHMTSLKTLYMASNELTDAQKDQIRKVVSENAPECKMEGRDLEVAKTEEIKEPSAMA